MVKSHQASFGLRGRKDYMSVKVKSIIYCRVSTKEQSDEGYSLEAQEKLLSEYAEKYGLAIVKTYKISESASGKQLRKLFNEVFVYATKHKIDVVLCEKIDRLTRNPRDAVTVDDWVHETKEREIHFIKEGFVLNQNTKAHESLVWDMKVAIARFYSNNLSEEVKKGMGEKFSQGWYPSVPPLGYDSVGEKGHKTIQINKDFALVVKMMFERYATGNYSLSRLEKELFTEGYRSRSGRKIGISQIHRILSDPFYYGVIHWSNKVAQGKHESIITKDLFDKVQEVLKRKIKNPHFTKHTYLFKSKMVCDNCGGLVTWYERKGHVYGHCSNHGEYRKCDKKTCIREDKAEEQVIQHIERIALKTQEMLDWIQDVIRSEHADKIIQRETEAHRISQNLGLVRRRKDGLYEDKLDSKIDVQFYERKFEEYSIEVKSLEDALIKLNDHTDEYIQLGAVIHELAFKAKAIYVKATLEEKRLLFSELFTNFIQNEYEIKPNYTLAADYLANWIPKLNENYEPPKSPSIKEKTPLLGDVVSFGSGGGIRTHDQSINSRWLYH